MKTLHHSFFLKCKPLGWLFLVIMLLFFSSCAILSKTAFKTEMIKGTAHIKYKSPVKIVSANVALTINPGQWIHFSIMDPLGNIVFMGVIGQQSLRFLDFVKQCRFETSHFQERAEKRLGISLDAETLGKLLCPELAGKGDSYVVRRQDGAEPIYRVDHTFDESNKEVIVIELLKIQSFIRVTWLDRGSEVSEKMDLPDCGKGWPGCDIDELIESFCK
jgi:hypothetical protein